MEIQATLSYDHTPVAVVLLTCICHCAYKHCHMSYSVVLSVTLRLNIVWLISVIPTLRSATMSPARQANTASQALQHENICYFLHS